MRAALDRFRVLAVLALLFVFAMPSKGRADAPGPSPAPTPALGLDVGGPIEIALADGSRIRGIVREISDTAAVVEYQSKSGAFERQTIALSAMQVALPPHADRWLDKFKWVLIIGAAVVVTVALLQAAGGR